MYFYTFLIVFFQCENRFLSVCNEQIETLKITTRHKIDSTFVYQNAYGKLEFNCDIS